MNDVYANVDGKYFLRFITGICIYIGIYIVHCSSDI
jgi:hypothetical protein